MNRPSVFAMEGDMMKTVFINQASTHVCRHIEMARRVLATG